MGAWGTGNFDNDATMDWLADLREAAAGGAAAVAAVVADALDNAERGRCDDTNACCAALAAAEALAAAGGSPGRIPHELAVWLANHHLPSDRSVVLHAVKVVRELGAASTLQELFDEAGRDEEWHTGVDDLVCRLEAVAARSGG